MDKPTEQQVAAWYPRLFRTAMRLTGDPDDSAELTQEAFCRALSRWQQFDGRCQPASWIHSILLNCLRDRARRAKAHGRGGGQPAPLREWDLPEPPTGWPGESVGWDPDRQPGPGRLARLREAIGALPDELRQPLVAAVLDGHPYLEVAEMLGIPVGTVAYRVHVARRRLAETLRPADPTPEA